MSTHEAVRHASGLSISGSRSFELNTYAAIRPSLLFTNSYVSVKSNKDGYATIGNYDNKIFALGAQTNFKLYSDAFWSVFLGLYRGLGSSSLDLDKSAPTTFIQYSSHGLRGDFKQVELGTSFSLAKSKLTLNLAAVGSFYEIDLSRSKGDYLEEKQLEGEVFLTKGNASAIDQGLDTRILQKILSLRLGLAMSFY
ncbi:MAG: hypothetical protein R3B45_02755 [Bdellovibrionota bacterium]